MAQPAVAVEGLDNLLRTMRRMSADLSDMKDANATVSAFVAGAAASRAPRRSGQLAGTVRGTRQLRRARISAGRASVPYAGPIHWGWPAHHIRANPFVTEAAQSTETAWVAIYARAVQDAVDKVKGA